MTAAPKILKKKEDNDSVSPDLKKKTDKKVRTVTSNDDTAADTFLKDMTMLESKVEKDKIAALEVKI